MRSTRALDFGSAMRKTKEPEQYSEEEAERRFVAAVKAGLNTKPTPLKSIVPKGVCQNTKFPASRDDTKIASRGYLARRGNPFWVDA
jgi:hypothetical protein